MTNPPTTLLTPIQLKRRHALHRLIYLAVLPQGLYGLYRVMVDIFLVYPNLAIYYQQLNYDQSVYLQIMRQAVLISVTGFFETAIGLSMMIKKSHMVKNIHLAVGVIIFLFSLYLKLTGAIPDHRQLERLTTFILSKTPFSS